MDRLSHRLPSILTLLPLSQKHQPWGHLIHFCHSVYTKHTKDFMEPWTNHRAGREECSARSLALFCSGRRPGRELRHETVFPPPFSHSSLSPRARLKGRTQNTDSRGGKTSFATDAASSEKQRDLVLGCLVSWGWRS